MARRRRARRRNAASSRRHLRRAALRRRNPIIGANPRRRRRNAWFEKAPGHRKAALRGWKRKHHRNPPVAVSVGSVTGSLTKGFSTDALKQGALLAGGAILNGIVRNLVMTKGVGMMVSDATTQRYVSYPVGLLTAGLLGYLGNMAKPGIGGALTMGGVVGELGRVWTSEVQPKVAGMLPGGLLSGLADLLTPAVVNRAIPLGLGETLTVESAARAVPMGGMALGADLAEMSASDDTELNGFGEDELAG